MVPIKGITSDQITPEEFRSLRAPTVEAVDIHKLKNLDTTMVPKVLRLDEAVVVIKGNDLRYKWIDLKWYWANVIAGLLPFTVGRMTNRDVAVEKAVMLRKEQLTLDRLSFLETAEYESIFFDKLGFDYLCYVVANMPYNQILAKNEKVNALRLWYSKAYKETSVNW